MLHVSCLSSYLNVARSHGNRHLTRRGRLWLWLRPQLVVGERINDARWRTAALTTPRWLFGRKQC